MPTQIRNKPPEPEKTDNSAEVLKRIERMVRRSNGFTLGFVKCNHPSQQQEGRKEFLARLSDKQVLEITLDKPIVSLLNELDARWDPSRPPDVVCVFGLEKSINELQEASPFLGRLNNDRDLLRRAVPAPLLIWLPDFALDFVARGAPDFWAWRSGVYEFATDKTLWQRECIASIASRVHDLYSLNINDKHSEIARLEELLRIAQSLPQQSKREKDLRANILTQIGVLYETMGEWDVAQIKFCDSLKLAKELNNKSGISGVLHNLAIIQQRKGNPSEAIHLFKKSIEIDKELGNKGRLINSFIGLGATKQAQGNFQEATQLYQESLSLQSEMGDHSQTGAILYNLGLLEQQQGNIQEAERFYRQSLKIEEDLGDKNGIAVSQ